MSPRPTWKGVLQISRVTIPIKVYPATESSDKLAFNQLHEPCQTRVQQKRWCVKCDREVPSAEIVKGFEFEKDRYVLLLEAELDAVQPPSTKVIELTRFADEEDLDPVAIDRSYFVGPDGEPAAEAFAVMSAAMLGKIGLGKLAIYGREYLVALRARTNVCPALVLHTLHHQGELRTSDVATGDVSTFRQVPDDQVRLARQLIIGLERPLDLAAFTDQYQTDVRALIDAKIAGEEIVVTLPIATPAVVSLREALEQSLAVVKKVPAKVLTPKRKRA